MLAKNVLNMFPLLNWIAVLFMKRLVASLIFYCKIMAKAQSFSYLIILNSIEILASMYMTSTF